MKKKEIKPFDKKYVLEKKKMRRKKRISVKLQGEILEFRCNLLMINGRCEFLWRTYN